MLILTRRVGEALMIGDTTYDLMIFGIIRWSGSAKPGRYPAPCHHGAQTFLAGWTPRKTWLESLSSDSVGW